MTPSYFSTTRKFGLQSSPTHLLHNCLQGCWVSFFLSSLSLPHNSSHSVERKIIFYVSSKFNSGFGDEGATTFRRSANRPNDMLPNTDRTQHNQSSSYRCNAMTFDLHSQCPMMCTFSMPIDLQSQYPIVCVFNALWTLFPVLCDFFNCSFSAY